MPTSKFKAGLWVSLAYVLAIIAAFTSAAFLPETLHLLWKIAIADVVATLVIFAFSAIFNNSSFYDPYWSIAPMVIVTALFFSETYHSGHPVRAMLVFLLVNLYGFRLTYNWWRGWTGLDHEDWRYVLYRKKGAVTYWLVSFSGFHLMPTVLVLLGCFTFYPVFTENVPLNVLDFFAFVITFGAILIEAIADQQLRQFRLSNKEPQKILETGLWKYSRHPNYFGETSFWWGLFLFALAVGWEYWWTGFGALSITLLFVFISIPMIDKRMLAKRPKYTERMKKVSGLIPWIRRR